MWWLHRLPMISPLNMWEIRFFVHRPRFWTTWRKRVYGNVGNHYHQHSPPIITLLYGISKGAISWLLQSDVDGTVKGGFAMLFRGPWSLFKLKKELLRCHLYFHVKELTYSKFFKKTTPRIRAQIEYKV